MGAAEWEPILTGDVGIFWVDQGQRIMASVPLADGLDDERFVNGPDDHEPYWETMQRTHVHLWDAEYDQVPRGRVLFNEAERPFYVYLDQVLCNATSKRLIVERFHLPRRQTVFRTDMRYTSDPDELDRLLSR